MIKISKKPIVRIIRWCVYSLVLLNVAPAYALCAALSADEMAQALVWSGKPKLGNTYKVNSWYVQDGDSLSLANGHRLRLGQINTTEMATKERPIQAYAQAAKNQLKQKLQQQPALYLQLLPAMEDRYGRWLVKVYDGTGWSVEEFLVARGLAYTVSMGSVGAEDCLWQQEATARIQKLGLWQHPISQVHGSNSLKPSVGGFLRMGGVVTDISQSKHYWYINLEGQVAVKMAKNMLATSGVRLTNSKQLQQWVGRNITARGWLAWRKVSKKQQKKGYKAGVMTLYHIDMLEQSPALKY